MGHGKPPKFKGVKSKNIIMKERYEKEQGIPNEGKKWSEEDFDKLITLFVWERGQREYCKELGRTWKSCNTVIWKIPDRTYTGGYIPKCLVPRNFKVWNERELELLHVCIEKGWTPEQIGRACGRPATAVTTKIEVIHTDNQASFGFNK